MNDFIAAADRGLLAGHGLADFAALWTLDLQPVDAPNTERGGWSCVYRLALGETAYYLKRQANHLTRSLAHPFGEPTLAREFRGIQRYQRLGIPTLEAAFYGERRIAGEHRALLLTRALDGWQDLASWLQHWATLPAARRTALLEVCGRLARRLHAAGQLHGCFYPKHIFLRETPAGFDARLIDLEKTRPLRFGRRDRLRDLEPLLRRAGWDAAECRQLLAAYLPDAPAAWRDYSARLAARGRQKAARR